MGEMTSWAEHEIELACKHEAPERKNNEWDYGCACYESALKAYKSLMEDGHSDMGISFTKAILNRLIDGKPLTPIEGADDDWHNVGLWGNEDGNLVARYQCNRMGSLFKEVYEDGHIEYSDVDRCIFYDEGSGTTWHNGLIDSIINELFPIKMPYYPFNNKIKVVCCEYCSDTKNGDLDTLHVEYAIKDDERIEIDRYFKDDGNGYEETDMNEYYERRAKYYDRVRSAAKGEKRWGH